MCLISPFLCPQLGRQDSLEENWGGLEQYLGGLDSLEDHSVQDVVTFDVPVIDITTASDSAALSKG